MINNIQLRNPETTILPARSISTLCIWITNVDQKEGFIPLLSLKNGIYM